MSSTNGNTAAPAKPRKRTAKTVQHKGRTSTSSPAVLDLDTLEAEHDTAPFPFRLHGRDWHLVHPLDLDWKAEETLVNARGFELLGFLLGEQFEEFSALPRVPAWKVDALLKGWADHYGIELGESEASPDSSESTAGRSKPTSKPTTASPSPASRPES